MTLEAIMIPGRRRVPVNRFAKCATMARAPGPMRLVAATLAAALAVTALPAPLLAQFEEPAEPQYFDASPLTRLGLDPFGDLRLRHENTTGIPGRTVGVTRARATLRAGLRWSVDPRYGAELSGRAAAGSDEDREFPRVDNDAPDTLQIDRANVWLAPYSGGRVSVGRMAMPLQLTELLWDEDLRPWGAAVTHRQAVRALDVVRFGAGVWRRDEIEDDGVVGIVQAGWALREGAEVAGGVTLSWLWFDDTERLVRGEMGRQNRVLGAGDARVYAEPFRIVDLQLDGRFRAGPVSVTAGADLATNVEADSESRAVRTRLVAGRFGSGPGGEVGWAYLRAEQEALPGAFASDDWWSRTRLRGHMGWVTLGWSDWLRLRLFGTVEWRDGTDVRTERAMIELTLRIPGA